ncbi:unnamed protein product [Fusarium graminearum]|nr:unnamed protein product [Fusarium graminearum]
MGNFETFVVDCLVTIEKNVQVDVTRALINDLFTSHIVLNGLKLIQQSYWLQFCLNLQDRSATKALSTL